MQIRNEWMVDHCIPAGFTMMKTPRVSVWPLLGERGVEVQEKWVDIRTKLGEDERHPVRFKSVNIAICGSDL
jgi:hypothetical protein